MEILKGILVGVSGFFICILLIALSMVYVMHGTIFNADFMITQSAKIDFVSLLENILREYLQDRKLPENILAPAAAEINMVMKREIRGIIVPAYDFLSGKINQLEIEIRFQDTFTDLKPALTNALYNSLSSEEKRFPRQMVEKELNDTWQEIMQQIPPVFKLNEKVLSREDIEVLGSLRQAYQSFPFTYIGVIFVILLLNGLIFLVDRDIILWLRHAGIMFLAAGIMQFLLAFVLNRVVGWDAFKQRVQEYLWSFLGGMFGAFADALLLPTIVYIILGSLLIGGPLMLSMGKNKKTPDALQP